VGPFEFSTGLTVLGLVLLFVYGEEKGKEKTRKTTQKEESAETLT